MPNHRKWKTAAELEKLIAGYFAQCTEDKEIPTVTGMAVALDTSRKVLCEYQDRDQYAAIVNRAKAKIEAGYEQHLLRGQAPAGFIFTLKNSFGWKDTQHTDNHTTLRGVITDKPLTDEEWERQSNT